jgi:hypothetical protein
MSSGGRCGARARRRLGRYAPWCPECDGTSASRRSRPGRSAGRSAAGSARHRFRSDVIVREEQPPATLYLPHHGLVEARVRALDDPAAMCALWMIGYEDAPERSAEICVFEIFGRDVGSDWVGIGMGVHPFGDPTIRDDFSGEILRIDAREFHEHAVAWEPAFVAFYVDRRLVRVVEQSPEYPMQLMLNVYEFAEGHGYRLG